MEEIFSSNSLCKSSVNNVGRQCVRQTEEGKNLDASVFEEPIYDALVCRINGILEYRQY